MIFVEKYLIEIPRSSDTRAFWTSFANCEYNHGQGK